MKEEYYISDWDHKMDKWPDCTVKGCKHKINLNLNTGKCFPHSEGSYHWKSFKILFKNTFIHTPKLLWRELISSWKECKLMLKNGKEELNELNKLKLVDQHGELLLECRIGDENHRLLLEVGLNTILEKILKEGK